MDTINYIEIAEGLNFRNEWIPLRINLTISLEQYIALLKGYSPHWDMRYGILYDYLDDYFYSYRSGYVVGKYKIEKQRNSEYLFTEMYENPNKVDCMVIFECVQEACKQNRVDFDAERLVEMILETRRMNEEHERVRTNDLGAQSPSDNSFTAKARKLQSIWRVQNGWEMGIGPNKNSVDRKSGLPTYFGNMLQDGEISGHNFYYPETFAYAQWRVNRKLNDETINAYRLFNNLMSSMPMAFNLFHPLMMLHTKQPEKIDQMVKALFPRLPIYKVQEIGLEFIPTPIERYTNDKSAMDAFIRFVDKDGGEYIIAIETKYTDSLGLNKASKDASKVDFARNSGLFTAEGIREIEQNCTQIWRNFLLTEKYREVNGLKDSYSIILAPKDHPSTRSEIDSITQFLRGSDKLSDYKLEDFVEALHQHCPPNYIEWLIWFKERYLDFGKLENFNLEA